MKTLKKSPMVVAAIIAVAGLLGSTASAQMSSVAVLELTPLGDVQRQDAQAVTGEIAKAVTRLGGFEVQTMSQSELQKSFTEHRQTLPAELDATSIGQVGSWLGVDYVISGTVSTVGKWQYSISMKGVEVRTGRQLPLTALNVLDINQNLMFDRLSRLVLWTRVSVDCNVPDYELLVDSVVLDATAKDPDYGAWLVKPGVHQLTVRSTQPNYSSYSQSVTLTPGEELPVKATLKHEAGLLELHISPSARISLDGEFLTTGSYLVRELPYGTHHLSLSAAGRQPVETDVTIVAGQKTTLQENLPVNPAAYRTPAEIAAGASGVLLIGGLGTVLAANASYNDYLGTMDLSAMTTYLARSKNLDKFSYGLFAAGGACAIWSLTEWIFLATNTRKAEKVTAILERVNVSCSGPERGLHVGLSLPVR
jgi:TolB-like protein